MERHLVSGFERGLAQNATMTINATSVNDFPEVTTETWPPIVGQEEEQSEE